MKLTKNEQREWQKLDKIEKDSIAMADFDVDSRVIELHNLYLAEK